MRLWYLSNRRPAKAQVSLRICAVSPEPSLFAYMKHRSRRRVWPKIRHLAPLDDKSTIISWDGSNISFFQQKLFFSILTFVEIWTYCVDVRFVPVLLYDMVKYIGHNLNEPSHEKMCLMSYANNKDADQPAHLRSLISTFVVRCLDSLDSLCIHTVWSVPLLFAA